jgi:cytochrome c oxidase subunit 2
MDRGDVRTPTRRRARSVGRGAALSVAALSLSACDTYDLPRLGMPTSATVQGDRIIRLWQGSWIAAFVVGALVIGLLFWSIVAYRKRDEDMPIQTRYNIPIELFYTAVPVVIIGVLFFFTARDETKLTSVSGKADTHINVVGYRWGWSFNYLDDKTYDTGTPAQLPTLWVPVDRTVRFVLTSPDVIHDFWVPAFIEKRDIIPGRTNQFDLTMTRTGTFRGRCAEFCGTYHARMLFEVKVVSQADYEKHMKALHDLGQVGAVNGKVITDATDKQGRTSIGDSP